MLVIKAAVEYQLLCSCELKPFVFFIHFGVVYNFNSLFEKQVLNKVIQLIVHIFY